MHNNTVIKKCPVLLYDLKSQDVCLNFLMTLLHIVLFEDEKFWIFYNLVPQALILVTAWRGVSHIRKHEIMPVEWKELAYVKLLFVKQEVTALERLVKDG